MNGLCDEAKVEPAESERVQSSTHVYYMNSATTLSRRNSPFSFTNPLIKTSRINSSSSRDTGDGGFFTDVTPRRIIPSPIPPPPPPPPPILECSTSNEWKHAPENQSIEEHQTVPLRKSSVGSLPRVPSKHSIPLEETGHPSKSQLDNNNSRPASSLSSASLPISMTSSKTVSSVTTSRKNSSSSTSTIQNSSSSTSKISHPVITTTTVSSPATSISKNSASPISAPKKAPSPQPKTITPLCNNDEHLQGSINSLKDKSLPNVDDSLKPTSTTCLIRDKNITVNDLPAKKRTHRRRKKVADDDPSKFRKLGFSMGDGLKWQEASME